MSLNVPSRIVTLSRFGGAPLPGKKAFPKISCSLAMRLIEGGPRYVEYGSNDFTLVDPDRAWSLMNNVSTDNVCGVLTDFTITDEDGAQMVRAKLSATGPRKSIVEDALENEDSCIFLKGRFVLDPDGEIFNIITWDLCSVAVPA